MLNVTDWHFNLSKFQYASSVSYLLFSLEYLYKILITQVTHKIKRVSWFWHDFRHHAHLAHEAHAPAKDRSQQTQNIRRGRRSNAEFSIPWISISVCSTNNVNSCWSVQSTMTMTVSLSFSLSLLMTWWWGNHFFGLCFQVIAIALGRCP